MNLFVSMLGVGLVTSIHCVFMCGGLVLTYAVKGTEEGPLYRRLLPHLVYQGAKILSYATVALILGGLVALLGRAFDITPFRNWLMVAAGVYMVLLGIGMTGKVKALRNLTPRPPQFLIRALSKNRKQAVADANAGRTSLATPLMFGLLTGLMPCAPLIAAQAAAISAGTPALSALAMVGFGLGTAPLMLVFGFASSLLSKQFQAKLQIVAAVAVMLFGLVILNRGLMVVGSPVTFETVKSAIVSGPRVADSAAPFKTAPDGVVEIPLTIENVQFSPQNSSLPADRPVRLIVDRKEANACSAQLAIPQLGVLADLKDNAVTVVDVPAAKAGSYTLTCGMGMMAGGITVGGAPVANAAGIPVLPILLLVILSVGAPVAYRRMRTRKSDAGAPVRGTPARAFALGPMEVVVSASLIAAAIVAGLAFGGFFN
ncbi:MAG: sulfite exporter TauE/SafE family protein [Coriobacteriia bacterium]|nr:sulfite exporter TauE/SafE family protein [Coriobacteriia bacterium]